MDKNFNKFKRAYLLKSTAWTLIIMPLFWVTVKGVTVEQFIIYVSIFSLFSLVIDLPISHIADTRNPNVVYSTGLMILALAYLAAITLPAQYGYISFLALSIVSNGILSGVEIGIIKLIAGQEKFSEKYKSLSRMFYLYTIPVFFLCISFYAINPLIPILIQFGALVLASAYAWSMKGLKPTQSIKGDVRHAEEKKELWKIKPSTKYSITVLLIIGCFALISAVVTFQNRTLPLLVAETFKGVNVNSLMYLAVMYAVGNVFSVVGVSKFTDTIFSQGSKIKVNIFIFSALVISMLFLSSRMYIFIFLGYVILCVVKGIYRPYYHTLISLMQPFESWNARWFSICTIVTTATTAILSTFIYSRTESLSLSQLYWSGSLFALAVVTLLFMKKNSIQVYNLHTLSSYSKKEKYKIIDFNENLAYFSKKEKYENDILKKERYILFPQEQIFFKEYVAQKFIEGQPLTNCSNVLQEEVIIKLCEDLFSRINTLEKYSGSINGESNEYVSSICNCHAYSHGDLHPDNILVDKNGIYNAIDWDFEGVNSRLLDEISFLFHPMLNLTVQERFKRFDKLSCKHERFCKVYSCDDFQKQLIVMQYLKIKNDDVVAFSGKNSELASEYDELIREVAEFGNKNISNHSTMQ